jgi:hypothetical protein
VGARNEGRTLRGHTADVVALAYSADGKTLTSSARDRTVRTWDAATGKELRRVEARVAPYFQALSPDAQVLAWGDWGARAPGVWAFAAGNAPRAFTATDAPRPDYSPPMWVALSPDGKALASAGGDHTIRLWEVATGKERCRFAGHRRAVGPFSFSRDGSALAAASADGTVSIWGLWPPARNRRGPAPSDRELASVWDDLASPDAARAYRAMTTLASSPRPLAPWLRERLRAARPVDARHLARLLADLDADPFDRREKAARELRRLGKEAEGALRKALEGKPSLELRRRIERLLSEMTNVPQGEPLRALRAVEVLEHRATPGARQLLGELALGPTGTRAVEARAALQRLRGTN